MVQDISSYTFRAKKWRNRTNKATKNLKHVQQLGFSKIHIRFFFLFVFFFYTHADTDVQVTENKRMGGGGGGGQNKIKQ